MTRPTERDNRPSLKYTKNRMIKFFIILVSFLCAGLCAVSANARERLLLIGGGDHTPDAMNRFIGWAGGADSAKILGVFWGSEQPEVGAPELEAELQGLGVKSVLISLRPPETSKDQAALASQIASASGVFFAGGSQVRIMAAIEKLALKETFQKLYHQGIAFGGTSAGASLMSRIMITGGGDLTVIDPNVPETCEGLGLLDKVIVDQHFLIRQRENRLFSLALRYPDAIALGVDEAMAVAIEDGHLAQVFGKTHVMQVQATGRAGHLSVQLWSGGDQFDLLVTP